MNALCKNTGGGTAVNVQDHDCTGRIPIKGSFVTMQKYDAKVDPLGGGPLYATIILAEVDVEFYV